MFKIIKKLLQHPLTLSLDIDDPQTTLTRRRIIQDKIFLKKIYEEWYNAISQSLPPVEGDVLELGSGGGFLKEFIPDLITSDVFELPGIDLVVRGEKLPFENGTLKAIVMTDVLHHISEPEKFFAEALRCLNPGGRVLMVEPWVTGWSRLIYSRLHDEPFLPDASVWRLDSYNPLSNANSALTWIILGRDREEFEHRFPTLRINEIRLMMPFRYLVSGGVSLRTIMPAFTFGAWRTLENALEDWMHKLAMFAFIVLEKS